MIFLLVEHGLFAGKAWCLLAEHGLFAGRAWYVCRQIMLCLLSEHDMSAVEHGMSAGGAWYVC